MACGAFHPAWVCWNEEISSLHCSRAARTSEWHGRTKWWYWPRLFNGLQYNQKHHQDTGQSHPGALQMTCPSAWQRHSVGHCHVKCGSEWSCDSSCPYRIGLITGEESRTPGGRANHPTYPQQTGNFRGWGCCPFGRISHCAEAISTCTTWICQVMGRHVWPLPLEDADSLVSLPLGTQLDLSSLGSMQVIVSHNPMIGQVQYQYQSMVIS